MGRNKVKNADNKVGLWKLIRWETSAVSVSINVLAITYVTYYCTDALFLEPVIVAAIFAVSKAVDSVTDVLVGYVIDRTNTRWGKGRPYEIFMALMWLSTWLMFTVPEGMSDLAKYVWLFCMYTFTSAICSTCVNGNNVVYMVRAFKTREQQTKVVAYGNFFTMTAGFAFNIIFPTAMTNIAVNAAGWSRLMGMIALPCGVIGLVRMLTIKEQYNNEQDTDPNREKLKVKDCFYLFANNHDAILLAGMFALVNLATGLGVSTYYFKYVIGNTALLSIASAATVLGLPIAFLLPVMRRKLGMRRMSQVGFVVQVTGYVMYGLAGSNLIAVLIATVLTSIGTIPFTMMLNMYIIDCADYNEMIGRPRMEGTMGSIFGLARKLGASAGTLLSGVLLSAVNYSNTLPLGIDNNAAVMMIRALVSVVPLIAIVGLMILMSRYRLDEKLKDWREEQKQKANAAVEAEA